ncbi:hypothetical protein BGY98DRAFT_1053057 [Russula aff. rugulosa BPL654]|nr:hypothetical protein BGY98DRAFT_1053057 [Russula aff. rugulosa BPL654]
MKVQCIDQLDKADAPLMLDAYEYLVSSTSVVMSVPFIPSVPMSSLSPNKVGYLGICSLG